MSHRNPQFHNPYEGTPEADIHRTTIVIPKQARAYLANIHTDRGMLQTTLAILTYKLLHELERNNINAYDPDRFEDAVAGCTITLGQPAVPGGTVTLHRPEANHRDDGRGVSGVAREVPSHLPQPSNTVVGAKGEGRKAVNRKSQLAK